MAVGSDSLCSTLPWASPRARSHLQSSRQGQSGNEPGRKPVLSPKEMGAGATVDRALVSEWWAVLGRDQIGGALHGCEPVGPGHGMSDWGAGPGLG